MESLKASLNLLAAGLLAVLFPSTALAQASGLEIVNRVLNAALALRRHLAR